jgi:hypothetical protein
MNLKKLTSMIKNFLGKIVSNIFLVALLLTTTVSNFGDRLETKVYNEQNISSTLIAAANRSETSYPTDDSNIEGKLYGDEPAESLDSVDDFVSPTTQKQLLDPTQIPAKKQPIIDRSNPDNKLLEKAGQMFDDSGVLDNE